MSVALANATIFTATGDPPLENASIVLDGDEISWVGPASDMPLEAGQAIDCSGKTILPGLVDCHAHLIYDFVRDPYSIELAKPVEEAAIDGLLNAGRLLEMGFTSIRDVGTRGNIGVILRDAVATGRIMGPRIKASKQIISVWGGLGDLHPTHIFRREQYSQSLVEMVTGPWEARNVVRQQVKDGVDWVKMEGSGTGFNPLCPAERDTMSFEEMQAIVDEAEEKGTPVACHAESRRSIIKAAKARVRTIEHAVCLDEEGIEAIVSADIAICPTLGLYTAFAEKGSEFGIPPEIVTAHRRTHERHVEAIRNAQEAGVTIIAGSDSGLANFPQGGGLEEICTYVEVVDMSAEAALLTATRDAARVIGFHDAGTLEVGKRADVLVFGESPIARIRALTEPGALEAVIQGGTVVSGALPMAAPAALEAPTA